jgi:hypothetical protein
MRSLIAFALLLPSAAALAAPAESQIGSLKYAGCPGAPQTQWAGRVKTPAASKLGELPPGNLMLTVVREVDGCPQDTVIRTNYGGAPFKAPKRK